MYTTKPTFVYGFHGLDEVIAKKILNQEEDFKLSNNNYDRAKQYAVKASKRNNSTIKNPFVLGAVLDLGNCFDLLDQKYLDFLSLAYRKLTTTYQQLIWKR